MKTVALCEIGQQAPAMNEAEVSRLFSEFLSWYDATEKDRIWSNHREHFRKFWIERVMNVDSPVIQDEEADAVIRILDRNGKGNTKHSDAVARAMVSQGTWRRFFALFRSDAKLRELINELLNASTSKAKIQAIDQIYEENAGRKNFLTGGSGNVLNAFLVAAEPAENLSVISLKDRRTLIEYLGLPVPFDWETASMGTRIDHTNRILIEGLRAIGLSGSARTLSVFCYWQPFQQLWKQEHTAKRAEKTVIVVVPVDDETDDAEDVPEDEIRESMQIQALLCEIGSKMGLQIWLPKSDRVRVLKKWNADDGELLDTLPLHYDDVTLRTIEQIDVLWLRRRSIVRAFEVEHTTSIYSGILRMADLIALQPNMDIKLHLVAPPGKREKVFKEIRRPVFSLLEGRALADICTYLSYENVRELAGLKHIEHLSDKVIDEYSEQSAD